MIDHNGNNNHNNSNKRRKRAIDKITTLEELRRDQKTDTSARTNQHPQKAHNMNLQVEAVRRRIEDKDSIEIAERGEEDKEGVEGLTNLEANRKPQLAGSRSSMCQRTANPQRRCTSPRKAKETTEAKRRNLTKRKRDSQHIQLNNIRNNKRPDSHNNNSNTSHRKKHKTRKSYTDSSPRYIHTQRPFSCKGLSMG